MPVVFFDLADLPGSPRVKGTYPVIHIGDRLSLRFRLERLNQGRREVLEVTGDYHAVSISLDARARQVVKLSAVSKIPAWRAVKHLPSKRLAPARTPRTPIV